MDAFQIIDGLTASFFGLIGIWAAVVRRHWFLRFVVVSVFLLSTVLITAHEIAIEFGIQIALLMAGVWVARSRKNWQFQFSMESALLLMVVVAVVSAVLGKTRDLPLTHWLFLITRGICTAGYGLSCLWLVFGRVRLRYRIPLSVLSLAGFVGFYHFSEGVQHAIRAFIDGSDWPARFAQHYLGSNIAEWLTRNSPAVLLGVAIAIPTLLLARKSGWFDDRPTQATTLRLPAILSRIGLIAVLLGVCSPLLYIFYRLMTPAQYPVVEISEPNGYDDVIAAGKLIDDSVYQIRQNRYDLSQDKLRRVLGSLADPLQRVSVGVNRPNFQIRHYGKAFDQANTDRAAIEKVAIVLLIESVYLDRHGTNKQQISWALKTLRLGMILEDGWEISWPESHTVWQIRKLIKKLDSTECRKLAKKLYEHDGQRQTLDDYLLPFRVQDENRGWVRHYRAIVRGWTKVPYRGHRLQYHRQVTSFRMLIVQLALQSYFLENDRLPTALAELVPEYLSAIPSSSGAGEPIRYQHLWGGYALKCSIVSRSGELIVTGPAAPYLWQRLQEAWQEFRTWSQGFATSPR